MSATMLIDNHKAAILGLMQEGEALLQRSGDLERMQRIQAARLDAERKKEPSIMFYGLYNAGKSTLINALCKNEIAKTGDVPTTASIQAVPWEGYTLIDTPGINAHAEHTEIAEKEIRQSDVILFVMDNADTFDNAIVYQAIIDILKMGKPLAIVINQKNVEEEEDPNIPVPNQPSILKIVGKVSTNLEIQGRKNGREIAGRENNFLGIFPVNAQTAFHAGKLSASDGELLYSVSGVLSLRNAINNSIRNSNQLYMLRTPLINLRDILIEAIAACQSDKIYGEKQQLAQNRDSLMASRQRLRDRLLADGLRKIDAAIEGMKAAAANHQPVENMGQRLNDELNSLLKEVAGQEQELLQAEIKMEAMPTYQETDPPERGSVQDDSAAPLLDLGTAVVSMVPAILNGPESIPISLIIQAVKFVFGLFGGTNKNDEAVATQAQRSQEQLANYYKWLNELRDQEIKIKATYEKAVADFLEQYYTPKLEQINENLAATDMNCAIHTENLQALEHLLSRVKDEMISLVVAV